MGVIRFLGQHKGAVALVMLLLLLKAGCELAIPVLTSQIVDVGITQLIRERGLSEADREELEHLNDEYEYELRSENYSVQRVLDKDIEFHKSVAAATHNPFIAMLHDFVADVTTESRYRTIAKVFEENDREYLIKTHRLTLDALEKKPGVDVNEVIEFSYFYWKDSYNW